MMDASAMTGASTAAPGFGFGYGSAFGAPQYTPQGFFGNLLGAVAQPVGGAIGSIFGQPHMGSQVGHVIGGLARFLPFSAVPSGIPFGYAAPAPFYPQSAPLPFGQPFAPQGVFGQQLAPQGVLGLPFAPQGFFGDLLGQIGQPVGGAIGALFGQPQLGQQFGGIVGGLAQRFLPFSMGPAGYPVQVAPQLPYGQQLVPQGFWGQGGIPVFASAPFGYPGMMQSLPVLSPIPQAPTGYPGVATPFTGQQPLTNTPVH